MWNFFNNLTAADDEQVIIIYLRDSVCAYHLLQNLLKFMSSFYLN